MMSCRLALAVVTALAAAPAFAQSPKGYSGPVTQAATWKNTCGQVQALVARRGYAVLTYAPHGVDTATLGSVLITGARAVSDRVVADQTHCLPRQSTTPLYVPTRDSAQCFAGYTCGESDNRWGGKHGW